MKTLVMRTIDIKDLINLLNKRFCKENQNLYCNREYFNQARRTYVKFMIGTYNPRRNKREEIY